MEPIASTQPRPARSRFHRWLLVAGGVTLVGIGAVGVFLPGLPTTIFLLGASWCFTRSCPWLEERLIRIPLFRPFLVYLDQGAQMPRKVVVWTLDRDVARHRRQRNDGHDGFGIAAGPGHDHRRSRRHWKLVRHPHGSAPGGCEG